MNTFASLSTVTRFSVVAALTLLLLSVHADEDADERTTWEGGLVGDFDEPSNWSHGIPGVDRPRAAFDNDGEVIEVLFDSTDPTTFSFLRIDVLSEGVGEDQAGVIFDLDGNTLELTATGRSSLLLDSRDVTFTMRNGSVQQNAMTVGNGSSGAAIYRLENATLTTASDVRISSVTFAQMFVTDGSVWNAEDITMVYAQGTIPVQGELHIENAQVNAEDFFVRSGTGIISINEGGGLSVDSFESMSNDSNRVDQGAHITVSGVGSLFEADEMDLGGGTASEIDYYSTFTLGSNGTAEVGAMNLNPLASLHFQGGTMEVTDGANLAADTFLEFLLSEDGQQASMTVAGGLLIDAESGLVLEWEESFTPEMDDEFFLIEYDSLTGFFEDLAEGQIIEIDEVLVQISYEMGVGNNMIGLTVVPEPHQIAWIFGAGALLLVVIRRRRAAALSSDRVL